MAAKKATKIRPTKDDVRTLKTLAGDGTKTTVIARKLNRTLGATRQRAFQEGVSLGGGRKRRRVRKEEHDARGRRRADMVE
jgi:hypothetical protein